MRSDRDASELDEILTIPELAKRWKRDASGIYAMARDGRLPFVFFIGSSPRARLADVREYEESRKVVPSRRTR